MSCPTIIVRPDCSRLIIRHAGPPGAQGADGEPGANGDIVGPLTSTPGSFAVWANGTGNTLADSPFSPTSFATPSQLNNKVDKVTGQGLSQENFTTTLKNKLNALSSTSGYRGTYVNFTALIAALPTGTAGDYALVNDPSTPADQITYFWDEDDGSWVPTAPGSADLSGAQIAARLFAEPNTNNFSDGYLVMLTGAVQQTTFDATVAQISDLVSAFVNDTTLIPTAAYTIVLADAGRYLRLTGAGGCTITLPDDATGTWNTNVEMRFRIASAVTPTILPAVGVTIFGIAALAGLVTDDNFTLKRVGPNQWDFIVG